MGAGAWHWLALFGGMSASKIESEHEARAFLMLRVDEWEPEIL